ncbi:GNAT family N-acetyltransferase [Pedobacter sp. KACC 23697]|uniref:GNAT family N-acetyltransferase n=1 Tax=Pedobacter sp. KACC 23697 TaxID=3149230 RepID=A0AAU7K550_9SPHI
MINIEIENNRLSEFSQDQDKSECWSRYVAPGNFTLAFEYLHLYQSENDATFFYTGRTKTEIVFVCLISLITVKVYGIPITIVMFGGPKTNGKAFWYDEDRLSYHSFVTKLLYLLKKQYKFQFIVLREFYGTGDRSQIIESEKMGFIVHHAMIKSYLDISLFNSFDSYFNSLPSKKRNYFRSVIKCNQDPDINIDIVDLTADLVDEIYPLYFETNARAKENQTAAVGRSVFIALSESSIKAKVITYRLKNKVIAFGLMFFNFHEVKCLFTGFDYKFTKEYNLWYQIMLGSIRFAVERRCQYIDLGSSSASMKSKFMAAHENVYISVLFKTPILTKVFKRPIVFLLNKFLKPAQ